MVLNSLEPYPFAMLNYGSSSGLGTKRLLMKSTISSFNPYVVMETKSVITKVWLKMRFRIFLFICGQKREN